MTDLVDRLFGPPTPISTRRVPICEQTTLRYGIAAQVGHVYDSENECIYCSDTRPDPDRPPKRDLRYCPPMIGWYRR